MATTSKTTKNARVGYWIMTVLGWLFILGPVLIYSVYAFIHGIPAQKVTLATALFVAIILTILSLIFKFHVRSVIFIAILGIYLCIENILPLIISVSVCTILDEFLVTPLQKRFKNKLEINKEIDKRIA